jgi:hypothetical protein
MPDDARAADFNHLGYNQPDTVLIAQLMGMRRDPPARGSSATPSEMYAIPNRRLAMHVRIGVLHRRVGRGREGRPGGVPAEAPDREQ